MDGLADTFQNVTFSMPRSIKCCSHEIILVNIINTTTQEVNMIDTAIQEALSQYTVSNFSNSSEQYVLTILPSTIQDFTP